MARRCFYSFEYKPDAWRASKIRNIGAITGNQPATDNGWETVTRGGDQAIARWINGQMEGRTCSIILTGAGTANRKWINYEIQEAWRRKMGIVSIRIHNITDRLNRQTSKGSNPLYYQQLGQTRLSSIFKDYDPPRETSRGVYAYIEANLENWVEEAIQIRRQY